MYKQIVEVNPYLHILRNYKQVNMDKDKEEAQSLNLAVGLVSGLSLFSHGSSFDHTEST